MKPTKNKYFCVDAGRAKMLFQSEGAAKRFIQFNAEEILEEEGKAPIRAYHCIACGGWHVTSQPEPDRRRKSKTERYFETHELILDAVKHKNKIINEVNDCVAQFLFDGTQSDNTTANIILLSERINNYMKKDERMGKQLWSYIPVIDMLKDFVSKESAKIELLGEKVMAFKGGEAPAYYCNAKCMLGQIKKKLACLKQL